MEQRLIRNLNVLPEGIYLKKDKLVINRSEPEPTFTLKYDNSNQHIFIKGYKEYLKLLASKAGYPDVFVAYWHFDGTKAYVFIYIEHEKVNDWFIYCLENSKNFF